MRRTGSQAFGKLIHPQQQTRLLPRCCQLRIGRGCAIIWPPDCMALAEAQGRKRGLTAEEVWTWHRMRYEL